MNANFRQPVLVVMDEQSKVGEARRHATALAQELGFDETVCGKVAIAATEAASNLFKHSVAGALIVHSPGPSRNRATLEILALDSGPGIHNLAQCLTDGFSTTGTSGNGLGAIKRLATSFDVYSQPEIGTALWARFEAAAPLYHRPDSSPPLEIGVVNLPIAGERVCGDDWAIVERDGFSFLMMVDGLGHGPLAAEAASLAVRVFREQSTLAPEAIIRATHAALKSTRGAAIAVARFDTGRGVLQYAGVGNISAVLVKIDDGQTSSLISHNGTVGYVMSRVQTLEIPWTGDSLLLMHSDGLATRWNLGRYPGICRKEPGLIAGVLYRDHRRNSDDVTVIVARQESRCSG